MIALSVCITVSFRMLDVQLLGAIWALKFMALTRHISNYRNYKKYKGPLHRGIFLTSRKKKRNPQGNFSAINDNPGGVP
ncbi:MAG: hypothetical protein EAZ42_01670 [Verrucomicrobia bacterium]|nr:MAG: hypothetical protein EAZ42_01670 [Verrucomicrobiota bacterium]